MCNCLEEKKKALLENKDKFPELRDQKIDDVYCPNVGYIFGEEGEHLFVPFIFEYKLTAKSGRITNKKKNVSMTTGYCPFCGEKVSRKDD